MITIWTHLFVYLLCFPPTESKGKPLACHIPLTCDRCSRSPCRLKIFRDRAKDRYWGTLPRKQGWDKGCEGLWGSVSHGGFLWVTCGCGWSWVRVIRHSQEEDSSVACLVWASPQVQSSFAPLPNLSQILPFPFYSFHLVLGFLQDWDRIAAEDAKFKE